ncbi:hypothetical protein EMMF5_006089 [Cystobasidiomycetes sp. EMM_F5]
MSGSPPKSRMIKSPNTSVGLASLWYKVLQARLLHAASSTPAPENDASREEETPTARKPKREHNEREDENEEEDGQERVVKGMPPAKKAKGLQVAPVVQERETLEQVFARASCAASPEEDNNCLRNILWRQIADTYHKRKAAHNKTRVAPIAKAASKTPTQAASSSAPAKKAAKEEAEAKVKAKAEKRKAQRFRKVAKKQSKLDPKGKGEETEPDVEGDDPEDNNEDKHET